MKRRAAHFGILGSEPRRRPRVGFASGRHVKRLHAIAIKRVFPASRGEVWRAWTEPDIMARWLPPVGFTIIQYGCDVSRGGAWRFQMRAPDGEDFWLGGAYRDIGAPERLVFTCKWREEGPETLVKVTLFAVHGVATRMIFRQTGFTSTASRDGHGEGWGEYFDQLADNLKPI